MVGASTTAKNTAAPSIPDKNNQIYTTIVNVGAAMRTTKSGKGVGSRGGRKTFEEKIISLEFAGMEDPFGIDLDAPAVKLAG